MYAVKLMALLGAILALAACSSGTAAPLPLAQDKPTFMFFYTDN
jgi:ABC-type glycerol-3-phosphate transport system substrate-binding protein